MTKIVFFTVAGMSAESGLPIFRGKGGIWDEIDADAVASKIHDYQLQLEQLKRECGNANTYFQSLLQLYENSHQFTENEFEELKHLFSDNLSFDESRMNFWFGQSNILMNEAKRNIAKQAYNKYNDSSF